MKNSIQNFKNLISAFEHFRLFQLRKKNNLTFTRLFNLRFFIVATLSLLAFTGCESDSDDLILEEENFLELNLSATDGIFDGANGGIEGFYFLPPMVKSPSYSGTFDAGLSPVVEICETKECVTMHATFSMVEGEGSELVRVDEQGEHYIVNWHTDKTGTEVGKTYRIRISVAGTVLGHADIQMAENGQDAKNLTDGEAIALVDGRTLPIKFRVEEGAVNVVGSEGGSFSTEDGLVNLVIPANATDHEIGITVEPVEDDLNDPDVVPGALFDFGPSPYNFNEDLTLTIKYDPANLPVSVSEDELRLLAVVNGEWVQLPGSSVDIQTHTVTGPLTSFSRKGVGRGKVHEISVSPSEASIAVGETVQFEAVLKDVDGQLISRNVQWSSSNDAVSTVDNSGLATAISLGESTIEAKSGRISGTAGLIVADGNVSSAFVTKWRTNSLYSDNRIALALGGTVDATIDWGDGTDTEKVIVSGPHYHTYATDGIHTVSVTGTVTEYNTGAYGGYGNEENKLIEVVAWGDVGFTNLSYAFYTAQGLVSVPTSSVGIENVTTMRYMFSGARAFNSDIGGWVTGNVTNMQGMFSGAWNFNYDIGSWDTSNVIDMSNMFSAAEDFSQDIGRWNTANVKNMAGMFDYARSFNQDIGNWNTGNVRSMQNMFKNASLFNRDITNWETGNVLSMEEMFRHASSFNQDIGVWDTGNVTSMASMFVGATSFNGNINGWNTANVTNMEDMFWTAVSFNRDVGNWNTSRVINMYRMFSGATSFNQEIGSWDTGNVTNMRYMFENATAFNGNIGNWNTANVRYMNNVFYNASSFNQDLSQWCVSYFLSEPSNFDTGATNWVLPRPNWGTCPTN